MTLVRASTVAGFQMQMMEQNEKEGSAGKHKLIVAGSAFSKANKKQIMYIYTASVNLLRACIYT